MSGDINAINSWARSVGQRARALAQNTGISGAEAREILIRRDAAAKVISDHAKTRTGK